MAEQGGEVVGDQRIVDEGRFELRLEPFSGRFEATDDRWLDQIGGLIGELRDATDGVALRRGAVPGTKGAVATIAVSVISAGGLTAVIETIRSWVGRDRSRSLKVAWSDTGRISSIELSGADVDGKRFDDLLEAVTEQLAGGP